MAQLMSEPVSIAFDGHALDGDLVIPEAARSVVLFAHGSGSSRHSGRNRSVAEALQGAGFGTLLMDLLTEDEARLDQRTQHLRFDIDLLAGRLGAALDALGEWDATRSMGVGLFGASTGAAAALKVAARRDGRIGALVSRGGRPDLGGAELSDVRAPTLLIVGGSDREVLNLNRQAAEMLTSARIEIVPRATHLFEEPGALEQVSSLAAGFFKEHLGASVPRPTGPDGGHFKPPEPRRRPPR
ncbi:dienelactone hydrolase family protein [Saccharopolyspora sp. CA-218241]|uniref:dienelactone hydrolase family protein n=1 Tax=Saccharopolyspora sp. CA-218241 TaxID=3240027 RepID=UPI003D971ABF